MPRASQLAVVIAVVLVGACGGQACPLCSSETGCQVRAGIFNEDLGTRLCHTLLPFPVFLGIVAAIHFGFPFCLRKAASQQALLAPTEQTEAASAAEEARS